MAPTLGFRLFNLPCAFHDLLAALSRDPALIFVLDGVCFRVLNVGWALSNLLSSRNKLRQLIVNPNS